MAGRMKLTPADIRRTIAIAVSDDIHHNQPELTTRPALDGRRNVIECYGHIDLNRVGAFGAQQLTSVIERVHPGLIAAMNGQRREVTAADVLAVLESVGLPGDPYHEAQAQAVASLVTERLSFVPDFTDL